MYREVRGLFGLGELLCENPFGRDVLEYVVDEVEQVGPVLVGQLLYVRYHVDPDRAFHPENSIRSLWNRWVTDAASRVSMLLRLHRRWARCENGHFGLHLTQVNATPLH